MHVHKTMYCYMHFPTSLQAIYCMYFHYMYPMYITWLRIADVWLLRLSQSLLTDTDSRCANYRCKHAHWDRGTPWGSEGRTKCFLRSDGAGLVEPSVILNKRYCIHQYTMILNTVLTLYGDSIYIIYTVYILYIYIYIYILYILYIHILICHY